ncbi:hypothetical protein [Caudoviricetes sp.]|nr:hypothetical protein [Caudoviricetes sp.]
MARYKFKGGKLLDMGVEMSLEEAKEVKAKNLERMQANAKSGGPANIVKFANKTMEQENAELDEVIKQASNPAAKLLNTGLKSKK